MTTKTQDDDGSTKPSPRHGFWLAVGSMFGAVALSGAGVSAAHDNAQPHFHLLTSAGFLVAYVAGGLALISFVGAAREWRVPFARRTAKANQLSLPAAGSIEVRTGVAVLTRDNDSDDAKSGDLQLDEVGAFFVGRTNLQAQALVRPHLGKPLVVDGSVVSVDEEGVSRLNVCVERPAMPRLVFCKFPMSEKERLAALHPGEHVRIAGELQSARGEWVDLTDCELQRVG